VCVYRTPSGRNFKLFYYSVLGKFLRDFSRWTEKIDNNRALFLVVFGPDLAKIQPQAQPTIKIINFLIDRSPSSSILGILKLSFESGAGRSPN
jgi:hypothetical protein